MNQQDVLIVGAGPVRLTLSCELARDGAHSTVHRALGISFGSTPGPRYTSI